MGRDALLQDALERSKQYGFLGPGPVADHLRHSAGFAVLAEMAIGGRPDLVVDIGSGGGVPGLVLALTWPNSRLVMVEAAEKRAGFLRDSIEALGLVDRVEVICGRAEETARRPGLRGSAGVVTARSFGPPAVTAECAVGFLRPRGVVVVSDPPEGPEARWPEQGLRQLHLLPSSENTEYGHFTVLTLEGSCPERYPRRVGVPGKRPLF